MPPATILTPVSRQRSSSDSSQDDSLDHSNRKISPNARPINSTKRPAAANNTDPEDGDDEEGEGDEDEDSDDDGDAIAPSAGPVFKRGHQTGLSVSLSNTSLGKRGRSPGSEDIEGRPMSKMSRTEGEAETSDDDAYAAVDDISDSEEEKAVEEAEEQMIINAEEEENMLLYNKRGSFSSMDSFFGMIGDDAANLVFPDAPAFFDEQMADIDLGEQDLFSQDNSQLGPPTRRVRFAEEVEHCASSSSTTESEDEAPYHPDLFLQQDALDPSFRRLIERKDDASVSDGEGSYWDFENEDRIIEELGDESGSESGSSGYETDEGETTDEDFTVPTTIRRPELRLNKSENARLTIPTSPATTPIKRALAMARRGPALGTFVLDDNKPVAVLDGHGKHILFYPAPQDRRRQRNSPAQVPTAGPSRHSVPAPNRIGNESDVGFSHVDPMLSSPANAMVSGFYNGRGNNDASGMSTHVVGPAEAFYPFVSLGTNGSVETDNDMFDMFSEDDDDDNLRIEDFINFDDDTSDDGNNNQNQEQADDPSSNNTAVEEEGEPNRTPQPTPKFTAFKPRTPSTPTPSGSMLDHFDRGVASSFRRNADRHKSWTRSPLAAGIKGGRFEMANNPISPLRRRKGLLPATPSSQLHHVKPVQATGSKAGTSANLEQVQFGGPLRKRVQNSNQTRTKKARKNTL